MLKAVLIGDSIRRNYQPLVAGKLEGRIRVTGPWENCRHSLWALDHYTQWVGLEMAEIVHVNFGIHDSALMRDNRPQVVLEQYKLCVARFFECARDPLTTVIWATTTPVLLPEKGVPMNRWKKRPLIDEYNAAALEIARNAGVPVNDLHQVVLDNDYTRCICDDGTHLTPHGNEVLAAAVANAILNAAHSRPGCRDC